MKAAAKICGISDFPALDAAMNGGARWMGLVFYARSPRNVGLDQAAALSARAGTRIARVGLFVDPSDGEIEAVLNRAPLDLVQLHGAEAPARVAAVKARFGKPVIKALGISEAGDFLAVPDYEPVADWLMFDAKPKQSTGWMPGGSGMAFDWRLLSGRRFDRPWILSGGLDPENVAEAVALTGAAAVDVSSGVEATRGVKDPARIDAFLGALHG